jgi:hypothetical protein
MNKNGNIENYSKIKLDIYKKYLKALGFVDKIVFGKFYVQYNS